MCSVVGADEVGQGAEDGKIINVLLRQCVHGLYNRGAHVFAMCSVFVIDDFVVA